MTPRLRALSWALSWALPWALSGALSWALLRHGARASVMAIGAPCSIGPWCRAYRSVASL
ncbi:hypothetical protein CHELA17_64711 [Chelatococcus asaccharovorans]|nr:hypothetical protein CHELA17_64711 [Chelatococcus asaccharovorans]